MQKIAQRLIVLPKWRIFGKSGYTKLSIQKFQNLNFVCQLFIYYLFLWFRESFLLNLNKQTKRHWCETAKQKGAIFNEVIDNVNQEDWSPKSYRKVERTGTRYSCLHAVAIFHHFHPSTSYQEILVCCGLVLN